MTLVSLTELKTNLGKYVAIAGEGVQDIFISKNGKVIAKLVTAKVDKVAAAEELLSMFPKGEEVDYDQMREERVRG